MVQLAIRLESVFMVEITSSDMTLLFGAPGTIFDGARMIDEFGSDGGPTPGEQDMIAGTTEVGVGKTVSEGAENGRRAYVLLKTKVVLEKDVVGLLEVEGGDGGVAAE